MDLRQSNTPVRTRRNTYSTHFAERNKAENCFPKVLKTFRGSKKDMTLKRVTCNSFPSFLLGHQCYAEIWTKIRSKLHARENVQAKLHPNKENFKLKKPQP